MMKTFIKRVAASCLAVSAIAYCKSASADQTPLPIPVPKEQWQTVVHDSSNNTLSIDRGTIARQGNFASFWTQTISPTSNVAISRVYTVGDCSSGAFQALWVAQANRQGKILANNPLNASVTPDRLLQDAVCQNQNQAVQAQAFPTKIVQPMLESLTQSGQTNAGVFSPNRNYAFTKTHQH
ncbi:MAG: hypothetical protein DSM106950_22815 [Stigonema ocellatum SAG 48.90 = DSM 106950]|nr:hypothetical protein [Stigonema ocellatum SAG 48.90 = DSM 106950]